MKFNAATYTYIIRFILLLMTIVVISLAYPRFLAAVRYLPVEQALKRYYSEREIPSDRLDVLIRFANEASLIRDNHRYHDGKSQLHLLRAIDPHTPALERRDEYKNAEAAAMESLKRSPAQPFAWLRLANIRWILHDEPENILDAWKMSIFTGRTDFSLYSQRLELGLAYMEYMDVEAINMLRDQLLLAWRLQPGSVVGVLSASDRDLLKTKELLNMQPDAIEELADWLEKTN